MAPSEPAAASTAPVKPPPSWRDNLKQAQQILPLMLVLLYNKMDLENAGRRAGNFLKMQLHAELHAFFFMFILLKSNSTSSRIYYRITGICHDGPHTAFLFLLR